VAVRYGKRASAGRVPRELEAPPVAPRGDRPMKHVAVSAVAWLCVVFSASGAHAYVDPGSGSMLLQLLLGGVAGLVVIAKLYWHRLLRFFRVGGRGVERVGLEGDEDSEHSHH
jgi:hypothetical protein